MTRAHRYGVAGEAAAAAYLATLGFTILARNLRTIDGEIDIVARDGATVVFIEVKARTTRRFGSALGAVDGRKRARIRAVARDYLQIVAPTATARFDVLAIDGTAMRLYRAAF
ncbi:MAG: hypothetical protein NVS2B3_07230 [Vulcanimicrobiaceae bacterium]